MSAIQVPKWEYHDKNIQGSIAQNDFTRADRIVIFTAPTPMPGQQSSPLKPIGLIQGMNISESKQLQLFFEMGSDAPMIIPGLTTGQLSMQRVLLNGMNFINAIYHGVDKKDLRDEQILRSIRDVNLPFDLMMAKYPVNEDGDVVRASESTLFRGCQISSRNEQISSGGVVVMEGVNITYATIPKVTYKY